MVSSSALISARKRMLSSSLSQSVCLRRCSFISKLRLSGLPRNRHDGRREPALKRRLVLKTGMVGGGGRAADSRTEATL
jgi:hypothetical protein